jgi:hypothetical protein
VKKGKIDGPDLAGWVIEEADALGGVEAIIIELDGPGVSCYDTLKRSKYAEVTVGVHTGARRSDGKNYNVRAKMWRGLLDWLKDTPCSIGRDGDLKAEATAMRYSYKDGLLLMEDKKQYKKRVGKSPDKADSMALTFAIDAMPQLPQLEQRSLSLARGGSSPFPARSGKATSATSFDNSIKLEINLTKDGLEKIYRDYNENRIVPDFRPAGGKGDEDSAATLDGLHRADSYFSSRSRRATMRS